MTDREKKPYTKPEVIHEIDLEVRAGSTVELLVPIPGDPDPEAGVEP